MGNTLDDSQQINTLVQAAPASKPTFLLVIAVFKLIKGLLLVATGVGVLTLLNKDLAAEAANWITALQIDPNNHFILSLMDKLPLLTKHRLEQISAGTFFYASLLLIEGVGLWLRKRWAEYFTVIVTSSLIPLEIYEIIQGANVPKIALLVINIIVVWYLIGRLKLKLETN